jgi:maleylpyruvate isomerase
VRIGLNWKGLAYEQRSVHLAKGEQNAPGWQAVSPLRTVPMLEWETPSGTRRLTQSLAILEYLEEAFPGTPRLLPEGAEARATVRQLAEMINSGIQPLQNLAVLQHVKASCNGDEKAWAAHWIARGMAGVERVLASTAGAYSVGDTVTLVDACLVPQMYGARRFGVDVAAFPTCLRVEAACAALPAFAAAHADRQPDAQPPAA